MQFSNNTNNRNLITGLNIFFCCVAVVWVASVLYLIFFLSISVPELYPWSGTGISIFVWSMPVVTAVTIGFSRKNVFGLRIAWACVPFLYIAVFLAFFFMGKISDFKRGQEAQNIIGTLSQDYVCPEKEYGYRQRFLTLDRENNAIIDIGLSFKDELYSSGVGKIKGDELIWEYGLTLNTFKDFYKTCLNADRKSIFNTYKVIDGTKSSAPEEYHLQKYETKQL